MRRKNKFNTFLGKVLNLSLCHKVFGIVFSTIFISSSQKCSFPNSPHFICASSSYLFSSISLCLTLLASPSRFETLLQFLPATACWYSSRLPSPTRHPIILSSLAFLLVFRSTSKSRPNNIRGGENVRPSVRPQKVSSISMKFGI